MAFRQVFFQIVIEVVDQRWRQGIGDETIATIEQGGRARSSQPIRFAVS
jgi:hypothetical protein